MKKTQRNAWAVLGLVSLLVIPGRAEVKLASPLFGDNMMLQREGKAPVWGTADPGEAVTVSVDGVKATATAGADGKWTAVLAGLKPGGPFTLTAQGKEGTAPATANNVLVGDVWICSGQSNMEYTLKEPDEIAAPEDPGLRYFLVPKKATLDPLTEIKGKAAWVDASPNTRATFTAVGYYFAKNLRKKAGVPIGLIHTSWGGTSAEVWIPREGFDRVPEFKEQAAALIDAARNVDRDGAAFVSAFAAWEKRYGAVDPGSPPGKGFAAGWASPTLDTSDWKTLPGPAIGDWSSLGVPNGGVVWVRIVVPVPAERAGKDAYLNLDAVPDFDTTYFNGEEIGHGGDKPPYFWRSGRRYVVPGRLVKAGDNVIAVRIVSQQEKNKGFGWLNRMGLGFDPAKVSARWAAKVETAFPPRSAEALAAEPQPPSATVDGTPTVLFNGMVLPLIPYGIKGVVWYQGESNTLRGYNYRSIFPSLISSWRARWGEGDFPFYFVQLANLGAAPRTPNDPPGWAELRESQLVTWKTVPHTGMAVIADIGEAGNIHPADKKDVGLRLSLIALANLYGKKIEYSGPVYESMAVEGGKIRLKFSHVGAGLEAKGGGPLKLFAIAGADRKFVWADAVIDGDTVVVSSPEVPAPVAVRYAWYSNPEGLNLYNRDGLPASPFRTDGWPAATRDKWGW
ncbi:MAG TPA: sialate O-acetylesterase [Candidatus Methylacidiphilales bacterium]